jgi:flagellar basal-body rod protein FlgG
MLDRLELAGHAMINKMAQMEVVTNNLANINTKGFKRDKVFVNELRKHLESLQRPELDTDVHVPQSEAVIDFSQGSMDGTGRPLDLAISGNALFSVETPEGEAYTRDGRLTLNAEGVLINLDGYTVLGEGGPIQFDLQQHSQSEILINETGGVLVDGALVDTLKIVGIDEPRDFTKIGANLYRLDSANELNPAENFAVKQGFLEESNVDPIAEMVALIEISHFYESTEKMIRTQDRMLNQAVNDIGKVG